MSLNILLPCIGSAGDVHPMIALAMALRKRGHRATVITNQLFQELIEAQGLGFLQAGTIEEAHAAIADPNLWHPRKGFGVIARRALVPSIATVYRLIERHADDHTVVASSGIAFGARLAHERLGVPHATVHLQPSIIRSLVDQGMAGNIRISASQPMWFKKAFFQLADWMLMDRELQRPMNEIRSTLGLPPIAHIMGQWMHSPQLVIGFFPEWFAARQPDWPANIHLVGFPLWDTGGSRVLPPEAETFLAQGEPPVVFTPGSAAATLHRFFAESVKAASTLGLRAMLVTNFPEQVPTDLPRGLKVFGYLPFSELLHRTALLVYHGGIGTLAQTIKAAIPHLVVANGHDQFDNGWRIERLGLGRSIPQTRYRAQPVAAAIRSMLADDAMRSRCREYSSRVDSDASVGRACELIEGLGRRSLDRAGAPVTGEVQRRQDGLESTASPRRH